MSNVVAFKRKAPPAVEILPPTNNPPSTVIDFISQELMPWALEHGVDINSTDFKFEAGTVMAVLQGMLFRVKD